MAGEERDGRRMLETETLEERMMHRGTPEPGTEPGTERVRDINTGNDHSEPREFATVNGTLYFNADDGNRGEELWSSDGTEAGTKRVDDIFPGPVSRMSNLDLRKSKRLQPTGRTCWM